MLIKEHALVADESSMALSGTRPSSSTDIDQPLQGGKWHFHRIFLILPSIFVVCQNKRDVCKCGIITGIGGSMIKFLLCN